MCGEQVLISRKQDWPKHVLHDFQPYRCIERQCSAPDATYHRLVKLRHHHQDTHPTSLLHKSSLWTCIFCEQEVAGNSAEKFCHFGRHMEEIAFSIVARQYEERDFYSDSEDMRSVHGEQCDKSSRKRHREVELDIEPNDNCPKRVLTQSKHEYIEENLESESANILILKPYTVVAFGHLSVHDATAQEDSCEWKCLEADCGHSFRDPDTAVQHSAAHFNMEPFECIEC